jgi:hypothetical protein
MSWRSIQLGERLCDQDQLIINLFQGRTVNYIGNDDEFSKNLNLDPASKNIIAIFNHAGWLSDLLKFIESSIKDADEFYIGINRYTILGNDIDIMFADGNSSTLIDFILQYTDSLGFSISKSGSFDQDQGRYFNFVQPITWVYGTNKRNR